MKNKFVLLGLLLFALPGYAGQTVFGRDGVQSALISPDGEHIAILNRSGDVDQFLVIDVTTKNTVYARTSTIPQRIWSVAWVDDANLVLGLGEDVKYQLEPQPTGEIKILKITGDSIRIGGANSTETAVQKTLAGKNLTVRDGLSSVPGFFLVTDQVERKLWRTNVTSDSIEPLVYPPFRLGELSVSPNAKYMAATGTTDAGEMRAMVWSDMDGQNWKEVDGNPEFVSVSDSGIAFAVMADSSGIAGLISMEVETGASKVLYQDQSFAVDQVMLDGFSRPFAARFVPGLPKWVYLDNADRLTQLHKLFRTARPQSDISFVSSSVGGGTVIAKQTDDDYPSSFFVIDTVSGRADRLLESKSALSIIGGVKDDTYQLRPINFKSKSGAEVSGYISLPQDGSKKAKPTVVMLRDISDESRGLWGFDEETWFLHRQGFNVLMLNDNAGAKTKNSPPATALMARLSDVEDAIAWLAQEDLANEKQFCFFGRGTGAELALLLVLRSSKLNCLISLGGTFENLDGLTETAQDNKRRNHRIHALLIYGTDGSSAQLVSQDDIRQFLTSLEIKVETMPVPGEQQVISSRQNEVRAYARISSFLSEHLARVKTWPTLPLTYEQALAMNELHEALIVRSAEGIFDTRTWRQWFDANDEEARKLLYAEQLSLYELYQAEIISLTEGSISADINQNPPIRSKSLTH